MGEELADGEEVEDDGSVRYRIDGLSSENEIKYNTYKSALMTSLYVFVFVSSKASNEYPSPP